MSKTASSSRLPRWMTSFGPQIIAALIVGLLLGLAAKYTGSTAEQPNGLGEALQIIGSSYVALLRTAVIPLIFFAVVASIANLSKVTNAARLAWQTLLWFGITALISVTIGMALGLVFQPGANTGQGTPEEYTGKTGDWLGFLTGLVPSNFLGLGASTRMDDGVASTSVSFNVLQILVIAIAVGVAALKVGKAAEPFLNFSASILAIIQKVLWWIIRIAPIGTVGLIGNAVATYGWDTIGALGKFTLAIYVGLALVLFALYPVLVRLHGLSIKQYFSGVWPAVQLGFVSRSSIGTLPLTQRVTERNLGVPSGYASFAVPLGATTKMDGCAAIYPAISAIFVAQFFQIDLTLTDYLLIALVSVLGSAATAGTTGAIVTLTLTLSTLGLPLAGVGLLLAVDPIVDMGRTAVNVAGQALVPTIVAKREGILDLDLYNAPRNGNPFAEDNLSEELEPAKA
ncbi:dicarboxylate/amino acid:cation symporter [Glutamicibacter protophormiae]|uniref:dicarboxylate/amino acid:cation symporter n=1 Tax=Glutamicibacter protophormiae TaxID=37930 RepID=UPI002A835F57|nr:dicarboxylate/amino acid:cation symporter [Glutamicibacter protophormiae]WPR65587.1 dicarboxylate/amino acid:cation symporter [Glutamicibacter protophormiae]WPR69085.1 dicarboxylate/amino acid:cation symporter [Glutamicibacter protophormiae]